MRQQREAASAVEERKDAAAAAAKEGEARNGDQLHIGEWVQLVPQECEDTLARKLQHVAGEKSQQRQQQQPIGEWLQHVPGGWVLSSSRHDPHLRLPQEESPDLWIRPPPQESYSKEANLLSLENNENDQPLKDWVPHGAEKCSTETSPDGGRLAETYEDWRAKFSPSMKPDTLPRTWKPPPNHRRDYRMTSMRQPSSRPPDSNQNQAPGAIHQSARSPEDAFNNNNNSINTNSNTQQYNILFDTNSNFSRNSMFYPSTTTRDDCHNKRWSLPHPLRAESRRPSRRQTHEQEGGRPSALLQHLQQAGQPRPCSMVRNREQVSSNVMNEHELVGQEQAAQDLPCSMRRLMFSEETIL